MRAVNGGGVLLGFACGLRVILFCWFLFVYVFIV